VSEYAIRYGRERVSLKLPDGLDLAVLAGNPMPALPDPGARLRESLAEPFGCPPLHNLAAGKDSVMIVVADHTRYNAYELWLPTLLDELNAAGVGDRSIQLYVGGGTHRPATDEEKRERLSDAVCRRVAVLDHDCDKMDRMKKIGRTDYGTVIHIDQRVFDAELLIITGGIQFHYFAGYSGGRKAIIPGCCARQTIISNHRMTIDQGSGGFDKRVRPGALVGNPVNEDMQQIASQVKPDLCINVILNDDKQVAWLEAGDHGYVLREGAAFLDSHNRPEVGRPAPIAIIGAGGYPKDINLYQAHKSLRHSLEALKPGATVFWLAQCSQGEGIAEFQAWRELSLDECRSRVQYQVSLSSFCALSLKTIAANFKVHLVSDLPEEHVRAWGLTPHREIHQALGRGLPRNPDKLSWLVIPDCSNLLPVKPDLRRRLAQQQAKEAPR
jgi:nickel-dependent lactate racemase